MGEVEASLASDEKLSSNGGLGIKKVNSCSLLGCNFGSPQTSGTSSDNGQIHKLEEVA
jgi:hypothetical protein